MKNRIEQWITVIAFCAFLGIMMVLYLFLPKQEFSELEKRYLEDKPELTMDTLTSGEFGAEVDLYMADHIPGRDFFVGLNSYVELYTGRQVTKDIYLAAGDRLVEAPVQWNEMQASKNVSSINNFAQILGREVDFMVVPSAGWAAQDSIQGVADPYLDESHIENLYAMTGENVNCVDMLEVFRDQADLYYRTDHHWTSQGAYKAYAAYMESKGREYPAEDVFSITSAEGFTGSTYTRAALWMIPGEPLEMWQHSQNIQVTNETGNVNQGVFYEARLQETDKYTVFLDGNHSVVTIENPDNAGKGSILVIRDSYSNCLGGFLAESYETVVLVDLRYINNQTVSEMDAQYNFDDVLVCYSLSNFLTDNNLFKLK